MEWLFGFQNEANSPICRRCVTENGFMCHISVLFSGHAYASNKTKQCVETVRPIDLIYVELGISDPSISVQMCTAKRPIKLRDHMRNDHML